MYYLTYKIGDTYCIRYSKSKQKIKRYALSLFRDEKNFQFYSHISKEYETTFKGPDYVSIFYERKCLDKEEK